MIPNCIDLCLLIAYYYKYYLLLFASRSIILDRLFLHCLLAFSEVSATITVALTVTVTVPLTAAVSVIIIITITVTVFVIVTLESIVMEQPSPLHQTKQTPSNGVELQRTPVSSSSQSDRTVSGIGEEEIYNNGGHHDGEESISNSGLLKDDHWEDYLIFDSIETSFDVNIFLWQFFVHVFYLPWPLLENPRAQLFLQTNWGSLYFNHVQPLMTVIMVLSFVAMPSGDFYVISWALWVPLVLYLTHKIMVAVKYATMSMTEYQRLMETRNGAKIDVYQSQLQLLASWLNRDDLLLQFEFGAAAARLGCKIRDLCFEIAPPEESSNAHIQFHYWIAFIRSHQFLDFDSPPPEEMKKQDDGSYKVSVYDFCLSMIRYQDQLRLVSKSTAKAFYTVFALVLIAIPLIKLCLERDQLNLSPWLFIFVILQAQITYTYSMIIGSFLYLSYLDISRILFTLQTLHSCIRLSEINGFESTVHSYPESSDQRGLMCLKNMAKNNVNMIMDLNQCTLDMVPGRSVGQAKSHKIVDRNLAKSRANESDSKQQMKDYNQRRLQEGGLPHDIKGEFHTGELSRPPRISLTRPKNVMAWCYARLALIDFGKRFRFRIDVYIGKRRISCSFSSI